MYTIDPSVDEPIMLLNKQIGKSYNEEGEWDGNPFIDGAEFQEELMYLDTLGKKSILIKINSQGGSVIDGMKIYDSILTTNTPVDTYNGGLAASIAGTIFMAGRKRIMADYAKFMTHPVSGDKTDKTTIAFTDSINQMIQSKCNLTSESISYMMSSTTWLKASECLTHGICTEVVNTNTKNKKYMSSTTDIKAMLTYSNNILNENLKNKNMLQVTNKLNLTADASEASILEAINKLTEAKNQAEETANEATTAKEALESKVETLTEQLEAAKAELQTASEQAEAVADELATTEATNAVNAYIPKIGDKPETLAKWVNLYKADKEGTKELLDAIPLNRLAKTVPLDQQNNAGTLTAASVMANLQNKFSNK